MMRDIEESKSFRKDRRRIERSGRYGRVMQERLARAIVALANDEPLDYSYHDHALIGDMQGRRECHILFDLVLVYRLIGDEVLILDRLNTHSEALGL